MLEPETEGTMSLLARSRAPLFAVLAIVCLFLTVVLSLVGSPVIGVGDLFSGPESLDARIFFSLRLPRFVLAFMIGAALAVSGVSFQSLLKNPLADPYILGISGGAALGYVVAIVAEVPFVLVPVAAFGAALASLVFVYRLACHGGLLSVTSLLLIGVVFNAFSFALILIINSLANFGQAQQILYLLLGSLDPITWERLAVLFVFVVTAFAVLLFQAKKLNILSLGDEEAFHLGVNVAREKTTIFVVTSLLVGASVSLCGLIGFVGLVVPHLARLIVGADNRVVLPAAGLIGGLLLIVCEFVAGNLFSFETLSTRVPVGAITALVGAPVFVFLLRSRVKGRSSQRA